MSICQALGETRLAHLKRRVSPLLIFFFLISFFPNSCARRLPGPRHKRPHGIYHVVKSGENLFRIGKAYGVPYWDLARINRIKNTHQLRVGQMIFVPGATRLLPVKIITPSKATLKPPSRLYQRKRGRMGFIWPVRGKITSRFGPRGKNFHDGIDIAVPEGTPIRAVGKGEVIYSDRLRGYGNLIIIRHPSGFASVYAHNRRNRVHKGQEVARGNVIGNVGSTGRVTGPHLHFEIRKHNVTRDPLYYLPPL
ncbi:MAG: LysM peptidoglycan-binding domain-containing M23 family metallopeptidase [Candidatus Binatia bacterium]